MLVSTKGRYALRFLIDLAQQGGKGPVPLKEIAERQDVSRSTSSASSRCSTPRACSRSTRGHQGGYQLDRAPELIGIAEVLALTEGGFAPVPYEELEEHPYTAYVWENLEGAITRCLENMTLADVLAAGEEKITSI